MRVRVEPIGVEIEVDVGESLMEAATREGHYWPTICGGNVECGACHCEVVEGQVSFDAAGPREQAILLGTNRLQDGKCIRLACCLSGPAGGHARVIRKGVVKN
jgi:2Fe-2S ferredoxin